MGQGLEAQRAIEPLCFFTPFVAAQYDSIASRIPSSGYGIIHEHSTKTTTSVLSLLVLKSREAQRLCSLYKGLPVEQTSQLVSHSGCFSRQQFLSCQNSSPLAR